MSAPAFVHLRLHSEYSITDGIVRIDDALARAAKDNMGALALTDLSNLFGMVKFYTGARGKGIKPLIGCDVWVRDEDVRDPGRDSFSRILLLVKNRGGYLRLCELLSAAFLQPRRQGKAEITLQSLENGDNSGLIALSGGPLGDLAPLLLSGKRDVAETRAKRWAGLFPDSYYLEIQRPHGNRDNAQQESLVALTADLAAQLGLPLAASHPIQFMDGDDFMAHEARVCIAEGYVLSDNRRPKPFTEQQFFKTQAEMAELFSDLPEAIENTVEIAKRCNLSVTLGKHFLPDFPTPEGVSLDQHLADESRKGLAYRLEHLYPDPAEREAQRPRYEERLEFEIKTIQSMGFPGYFLIVADFIQWSKNNGVPVGPGRGSGAGSLVAYSLLITDLDPLYYELLFERFLNPERVSMPDFDVDFCQEGRDRVIQYVKDKYGAHCVSQIATFGTMAAKAVIRDVGRVLDLPFNFVDQFAKLIPNELGISLTEALEKEPQMRDRVQNEEEIGQLWDLAIRLEGMTRNVGMHAGGVLIAPGKLTDFCPLYSADGSNSVVSQFDKDDVEKAGLVKFDFLGLRTLTILKEAVEFANNIEGAPGPDGKGVVLESLPLDDQQVYENVFRNANTTAVFQFESRGMKDMLVQAKPDRLEDLIALNALYRPGPMDLIPSFINRKHGREKVTYLTPGLEKVLSTTYGIMVYQEQVMQTAQVVSGYSLGGADMLRRAMGKKKPEEMAVQRQIFVDGAGKNGITEDTANEIFDYIDKFAGYGFNKSHAAAYSLVAYHTAWLKCHHPASFLAATLSSEMADTDKVQFFFKDGKSSGLTFLPPDINSGGVRFQPVDSKTIRYGLGALKGTGESALTSILKAREEGGPFKDLFDFCKRVDKRSVNRRVIESLIKAGAFDGIDDHRHKLIASVSIAMEAAEQAERNALQGGLFDMMGGEANDDTCHYADVPRWSEREQLLNEKQALGFFLSGHPFNAYRKELSTFVKRPLGQLSAQKDLVLMAGVVLSTRTQMGRRGKMCILTLDDGTDQLEVVVYNELWDAERAKIKEDELLLVEGKVQDDAFSGGLRVTAEKLHTLGEARGRFARRLHISMNGQADARKLHTLLSPYREGPCLVRLSYQNQTAKAEMNLSDIWRVRLDDALLNSLTEWLTPDNVKVVYA